jgi:hypothetical protein
MEPLNLIEKELDNTIRSMYFKLVSCCHDQNAVVVVYYAA